MIRFAIIVMCESTYFGGEGRILIILGGKPLIHVG